MGKSYGFEKLFSLSDSYVFEKIKTPNFRADFRKNIFIPSTGSHERNRNLTILRKIIFQSDCPSDCYVLGNAENPNFEKIFQKNYPSYLSLDINLPKLRKFLKFYSLLSSLGDFFHVFLVLQETFLIFISFEQWIQVLPYVWPSMFPSLSILPITEACDLNKRFFIFPFLSSLRGFFQKNSGFKSKFLYLFCWYTEYLSQQIAIANNADCIAASFYQSHDSSQSFERKMSKKIRAVMWLLPEGIKEGTQPLWLSVL